jgi:beta-glucosidase
VTQPRLSRRTFLAAGSLTALGAIAPGRSAPAQQPAAVLAPTSGDDLKSLVFPDGFRWGTATSSYQIEGAAFADGRGPSIWDTFCRIPGKIRDGSNGDIAADHYHRYPEDVALMQGLGAKVYRFSVAWPRILPQGTGAVNGKGLAFYDKLVDTLLAAGIEPFATMYHWDLPQALQDKGGWQNRDTAQAFADYAGVVARRLGDRVTNFFTLNEIQTFVEHGHRSGAFAPGLKLESGPFNQVRHHAVLAHGLGVQAIRSNGRVGTRVGPAENLAIAVPAVESPAHVRAAEIATRELNAAYLTVMMEGRYTDRYLERTGADAPKYTPRDLEIISTPVDFVGLNVYSPTLYVLANDAKPGWSPVRLPASHPRMSSDWLTVSPEALYWAPRHAYRLWKKDLYITENGASAADKFSRSGQIYDIDRVMYLRNYLTQLQRATREGVPVRGYFLWSLLDNFEWADGYATRFGIVHVDYETQKRTPKLSASFFREVIARNAVA